MNFKLNEELKITVEKLENLKSDYFYDLPWKIVKKIENWVNSSMGIIDDEYAREGFQEQLISEGIEFIKRIKLTFEEKCLHTNLDKYIEAELDHKQQISHLYYKIDCKDCLYSERKFIAEARKTQNASLAFKKIWKTYSYDEILSAREKCNCSNKTLFLTPYKDKNYSVNIFIYYYCQCNIKFEGFIGSPRNINADYKVITIKRFRGWCLNQENIY